MLFIQFVNKYKNDEWNKNEKEFLVEEFNRKQKIEYEKHHSNQYTEIGLGSHFSHLRETVKFV
jgi:hypothetical protein